MLKDFRDVNKDVITMFKDTDKTHSFILVEESGSAFIWNNYDVTCEGRLSLANEVADFAFNVEEYEVDGIRYGIILFPASAINSNIRENRISWRVLAKHKTSNKTRVINYGDILLKGV